MLENVRLFNGERGRSESFDLLDALLNEQAYRLASWKVASEEINYRRFFDINELAAIRMEDETVFQEIAPIAVAIGRARAPSGDAVSIMWTGCTTPDSISGNCGS